MREIEGLLSQSVNTCKKSKELSKSINKSKSISTKKSKKTTHIRILPKTKKKIQELTKMNEVTIPRFIEIMLRSYLRGK